MDETRSEAPPIFGLRAGTGCKHNPSSGLESVWLSAHLFHTVCQHMFLQQMANIVLLKQLFESLPEGSRLHAVTCIILSQKADGHTNQFQASQKIARNDIWCCHSHSAVTGRLSVTTTFTFCVHTVRVHHEVDTLVAVYDVFVQHMLRGGSTLRVGHFLHRAPKQMPRPAPSTRTQGVGKSSYSGRHLFVSARRSSHVSWDGKELPSHGVL